MRLVKSLLLAAAVAASALPSVASATGCTGADCTQSDQSSGGCHGSKSDPVSS
ncbi:hypothetical protein [Aquibium microcysteis]|uniref:hypothetical protein n=1 Tax=Aquibium microcysteis TaxID=675281 RepID=UPI00165D2D74|nr:hypothetical protein [Aquibium microcysteis]